MNRELDLSTEKVTDGKGQRNITKQRDYKGRHNKQHIAEHHNTTGLDIVSLSSAEVPRGFSRGNGEQARTMDILEDWGRERWARGDLWEGGRVPARPIFSLFSFSLSLSLSLCLSVSLSLSLSVSVSVSVSVSLSLSVPLSLFVCLCLSLSLCQLTSLTTVTSLNGRETLKNLPN